MVFGVQFAVYTFEIRFFPSFPKIMTTPAMYNTTRVTCLNTEKNSKIKNTI